MADGDRELTDLKREVVEARNQTIKTHNQLTNLALDVKGFEKRFDLLERRTRLASIGAHLVVALVIAGAAFLITSLRSSSLVGQIDAVQRDAAALKGAAAKERDALAGRLREAEDARRAHDEVEKVVLQVLAHLDQKRDSEAIELLGQVRLDALTGLERKIVGARIEDLKKRAAEAAYREGRAHWGGARYEQALAAAARVLELDPQGRWVEQARYLEATSLYNLKRYEQAEPALRGLKDAIADRTLAEEVRFYLATTLLKLGKNDEAKSLLKGFAGGRYAGSAKVYLAQLEETVAPAAPKPPGAPPQTATAP